MATMTIDVSKYKQYKMGIPTLESAPLWKICTPLGEIAPPKPRFAYRFAPPGEAVAPP